MRLPFLTIALVAPAVLGQVLLAPAPAHAADDEMAAPPIEKLARPDDEARGVLWENARLEAPAEAPDQKEIADVATQSFGLLAGLRSWRSAFGPSASTKRELLKRSLGGQKLALSLGNVASPSLAGFASSGLSASYGFLEMGTSLRARGLDSAFATWDGMMTGETAKPTSEDRGALWMRAKPWQTRGGELELSWMRAERDLTPTAQGGDKRGTFWGGRGRLALPMGWSLNGDWTQAQMESPAQSEGGNEGKLKWNALAAGPIAHPFGQAKASLEWHETEAGFSNLTGSNTNGESVGNAQLTQDVKTDLVQGQLKLVTSRRARLKTDTAAKGEALETNATSGTAQAKLNLLPNLSLSVNGTLGATQKELAEADFATQGETAQNEIQTQSGDVGLEWKAASISFGVSTGRSQTNQWSQASDAETRDMEPELAENRVAATLRHQRKDGLVGVQLAARNRAGKWATTTEDERWQRLTTLRLEAEQKLIGDFKIRTVLDLAQDRDSQWGDEKSMARRAEAQLTLTRATRLDLKFRDGAALPSGWLSDSLGTPFSSALGGTFQTGDREFGARFNTGSAAGGKGLGLAVEFARAQRTGSVADTDTWKVGLTYR